VYDQKMTEKNRPELSCIFVIVLSGIFQLIKSFNQVMLD